MYPEVTKLLSACRESVQPQMRRLPVYNPALEVEAVEFAVRQGRLCGVLLTPWCMNLVLFPAAQDAWANEASAGTIEFSFPSGVNACMRSAANGISPHLILPLFTTVLHFADQDTARSVAKEVLRRLYLPQRDDGLDRAEGARQSAAGGRRRTMTRRELLLGLGARP